MLALRAGGPYIADPALLLRDMSDITLGLWMALYRIDPWGEERADLRAGIVASTVVNMAGKTLREGAKPSCPHDYMPYAQRDARQRDSDVAKSVREFFTRRG